jgi:hypothetical protein
LILRNSLRSSASRYCKATRIESFVARAREQPWRSGPPLHPAARVAQERDLLAKLEHPNIA